MIVNNNGFDGYSGFDNFLLEGTPTNTIVEYTAPGGAVMEDAGTYNLDLEIHAPDMTASTSADVVLVGGNASDVNGFSSQTVTFPGGSSTDESVNLTITDNNNCDGDRDLVFEIQNVSGGNAATLGIPSHFTLTIQDDESNTSSTITPTVCDSFTVPSDDTTYTSSGTYMDTIPNSVGCDSIITIDLQVDTSTSAMVTRTVCDSFTVPSDDTTYTTSGTYMDTIANDAGCDSVITFDLTIDTSTTASIAPVACNSYTVPSGDTTYSSSGVYMDTIPNMSNGCDSLITIDLTIDTNTYGSTSPTTCVSYTVPSGDTTYTSSGMYVDTLHGANAFGCDSIIDIDLTVNSVDTSVTDNSPTLVADAPSSASFQWIDCSDNSAISGETGQSFTASSNGDYAVEVTQNGCTDTSSCYSVDNVGIEASQAGPEMTLRPNPTEGGFTIETAQSGSELDIRIIDLQGRTVYERDGFRGRKLRVELDRPDGLYFVRIRSEKGSEVLKLVKE